MRLSLSGFAESWAQSRVIADYVARYSASDRFDPEGLATRVSSFINEVLELIFANHGEGTMAVDVTREDEALHVACTVPTTPEVSAVFEHALGDLGRPLLLKRHCEGFLALLDAPELDPAGAFVEMAAVFGLTPSLTRSGDAVVVSLSIPAE